MGVLGLTAHFDSEEACRLHFNKIGARCHRCGHDRHYWTKSRVGL